MGGSYIYCRIIPITGVSRKWEALEKLGLCRLVAAKAIRDDELAAAGVLQVFMLYPRAAK